MERVVQNWTLANVAETRERIGFPGFQREPNLWSVEKKKLLIDSVFRNIDIPKLYFALNESGNYDVVDGQQRLWAIWDYINDEFAIEIDGLKGRRRYSELTKTQQDKFDQFELQIVLLTNADDEYLRELFLRLQLGLLLITGEKLKAETGEMRDFVFNVLARKSFVRKLGIPRRRFAKQTFCAQLCINLFSREKLNAFSRTRYEDLQQFFRDYRNPIGDDRERFEKVSSRTRKLLTTLDHVFGESARELNNRSYVLSLCLLFDELRENEATQNGSEDAAFVDFALEVWRELKREKSLGIERQNKDLFEFQGMVSSAPGEKYQIARRHEKLKEFYEHYQVHQEVLGC